MTEPLQAGAFARVVGEYVARSGYNTCQAARLAGLPRRTIANWLEGVVQKPRHWQDVVKLARALRLDRTEADELLRAAGYPPLFRLQAQAQNDSERSLLAFGAADKIASDNLPPFQAIPDLPTFVGRAAALSTLAEWLLADHHPTIYVLEGMAGVGKTALAARLAYRLRSQFPDGVLWARPDTMSAMSILQLLAAAYGQDVTVYADLDSRSTAVRQLLGGKRVLLVLDNVQSSGEVEPLLPPTGPSAVLVTTRHRNLSLARGARRFYVESFTEAEALVLIARVLGEDSVAGERTILAELAALVGGLPLAIDIIACRLADEPGWSAADFLAKLRREDGRLRHLVHEERCVRTALAATYARLSPRQQRLFAALGALDGAEFSVETAAAAANVTTKEAEAILGTLFCLSLVRRGRAEPYRLTPLLRTLAQEV